MGNEKLCIIGGSGLYQIEDLNVINEHSVDTPYGKPSGRIIEGKFKNSRSILFLPRHGLGHAFLPHEVNYRANIWALKKLGGRRIIGFSAVGSLRKDIAPPSMAIISQYIDLTKGIRAHTFFQDGITGHVSTAQPACPSLSKDIKNTASSLDMPLYTNTTYACVEGPRLGTKAESLYLQKMGADVVGMTNVPEAFLAREAQMAYCTVGIVTDYDCWLDDPGQHAQANEMIALYMQNIEKVKALLKALAQIDLSDTPEWITKCLKRSILTPSERITKDHKKWLTTLQI